MNLARRTFAALILPMAISVLSVYLPSVSVGAGPAQQPPPYDLPAAATLTRQLLGTAEARLATCQAAHEAAYAAAWECAGRVAAAQTALAMPPTPTPAP